MLIVESNLLAMAYVRGATSDYDDWAKLGNEGWSTADLLPLMKKSETFTVAPNLPTHGYSGPTKISKGGGDPSMGQQFLDVGKAYDPTTPQVLDNNDLITSHAYSLWYKYIDPKTGRRSDAATNYLYPNSGNPNLQILVGKRVKRVIFENNRAVAIEYLDDAISCPGGTTEVSIARAANAMDGLLKMRPTPRELESMGPDFGTRWESFFKNSPDKPVANIVAVPTCLRDPSTLPQGNIVQGGYYILYPGSVGRVHISSGQDANAPPDFDPQCLLDPSDLSLLIMLYKKSRELLRRMPCFRGEVPSLHPMFPEGSAAACKRTEGPVPINAPDIVYSPEDNKAIEKYTRDRVQSIWHSLGTCAMKPRDQGGVVDARLNVYGVEGLKVAVLNPLKDMSIAPKNVGTNTYSTALVIGEKAAVIIAEDLGIKGVV
ncbi:hypothetical protein ID866_9918 [Astraeus odoratus]|nr:hypothetical protein ID866_9918 [Astraeus odoratus]